MTGLSKYSQESLDSNQFASCYDTIRIKPSSIGVSDVAKLVNGMLDGLFSSLPALNIDVINFTNEYLEGDDTVVYLLDSSLTCPDGKTIHFSM